MSMYQSFEKTIHSLLIRITIVPFALVLFLLFFINSYMAILALQKDLKLEAKEIANILSITASNEMSDSKLLAHQIDTLLDLNEKVVNVTFYPTDNTVLNTQVSQFDIMDPFISHVAPVSVGEINSEEKRLLGYLNVTMDFHNEKIKLVKKVFLEFFLICLVLTLLFFWLRRSFFHFYQPLLQMMHASKKLLSEEYEYVNFDERYRARSKDARIVEDALLFSATKLRSKQKQIQELQKINSLLYKKEKAIFHHQATFQAMITHELRTPLNAIGGGLQLLDTQQLSPSLVDSVGFIKQGFGKLNSMLAHIIELNEINQGKVNVSNTLFNPEDLLRNIAEQFSHACLVKGVTIDVNVKHTPIKLLGDEDKIKSIICHFMDNAVKFTESGSITLVSNISFSDKNKVVWRCHVIDTGIGIEDYFHEDIFNAYMQVNTGKNREFEGSGLGLTLAKRMSELLDGEILLSSTLGEGSDFCLKLLLNDGGNIQNAATLDGYKFLHFHKGFSEGFVTELNEVNAQAVSYQNSNLALRAIKAHNFDMITICSQVDEETVIEFTKQIRQSESAHRAYIIYLNNKNINENKLATAGVDFFYEYVDLPSFIEKIKLTIEN